MRGTRAGTGYHDWACFAAQQAAEKALNALAGQLGGEAWGHSVLAMLSELATADPETLSLREAAVRLDRYYIPTRRRVATESRGCPAAGDAVLAYNRGGRARVEARRRQTMELETPPQRVRPVTGTHVVRVQHEGIVTADAERSRDFYCRVLGLQVLPRPAFATGGYWLGTPGIFPQIHIIQSELRPPGPDTPISPRARHTCFEVADYDAMKAALEREGIAYVENTQPGGRIQMLCNDPDGNTLEFQPATV